eukprot:CAMPEP_0197003734 /NCGR_PEP_ID=MMETSP1380-20130617/11999_1 /TAXON_ID=5936 /ORGANISM="Euplotes crassus, Strain CT5" /LENGTH=58 /DNA_ID=CAMNT_0042422321 /DNA_START=1 /DNA_END=173 /DNA_ORIENTATION=+
MGANSSVKEGINTETDKTKDLEPNREDVKVPLLEDNMTYQKNPHVELEYRPLKTYEDG